MRILGIETSCDETGVGIVEDGQRLLSNALLSSMDLHVAYGGVVPEIAARSHLEAMTPVIEQAFTDAKCTWKDIDGIAVTNGAGLGGSLLIGVMTARTLAIAKQKPLYGINHVEGHVYANFLTDTTLPGYALPPAPPRFPLLALIVSGKHSQLVIFRDHFDYTVLGNTRDDAIGEAFDKVAKMLGFPYPGGPAIAQAALAGDPNKYAFPKSKMAGPYDCSYSGLKTAVLRQIQVICGVGLDFPSWQLSERLNDVQKQDLAASFQRVAVETVVDNTLKAYAEFQPQSVVIAGGVAANQELRHQLTERLPLSVTYTDTKLCTDNGAMVATLGCFKVRLRQPQADPFNLDINPSLVM